MTWHILPINDIYTHEENTTCRCRPSIELENGDMIVIHNSFDGREYIEQLTDNIDYDKMVN